MTLALYFTLKLHFAANPQRLEHDPYPDMAVIHLAYGRQRKPDCNCVGLTTLSSISSERSGYDYTERFSVSSERRK